MKNMRKNSNAGHNKKILVLALQGIGNTLLVFPMIQCLRRDFPESSIDVVLTTKGAYELAAMNKDIDNIIRIDFSWKSLFSTISQIRKGTYDVAVATFPPAYGNDFMMFFGRAKIKIGIPDNRLLGKLFRWSYSDVLKITKETHDKNQNLRLSGHFAACPENSLDPILDIGDFDNKWAMHYLKSTSFNNDGPFIGIQPGSGNGMHLKRWPARNFARLCEILVSKYRATVIFFGEKDNNELLLDISRLTKNTAHIVCGEKFSNVCAIIKKCDLFISNDSGLMHVAAALGTPVIAIFGPTDYKRTGPCGTGHVVIKSDTSCAPCYTLKTRRLKCLKKTSECMKSIPVEKVLNVVENHLDVKYSRRTL